MTAVVSRGRAPMSFRVIALCIGVLAAALLLTGLLRRRALRERWLDVPNERSSHSVVTPAAGGAPS